MARFVIIENGVVDNAIIADEGFTLPGKTLIASDTANIGDTWDGSTFTPPAPPPVPVPDMVTPRQMRLALDQLGMFDAVEAYVASAPRPVQIAWEYAIDFQRDNALIAGAATALGKTTEDIDNLFRLAVTL